MKYHHCHFNSQYSLRFTHILTLFLVLHFFLYVVDRIMSLTPKDVYILISGNCDYFGYMTKEN